jgi:hypothetical protein
LALLLIYLLKAPLRCRSGQWVQKDIGFIDWQAFYLFTLQIQWLSLGGLDLDSMQAQGDRSDILLLVDISLSRLH